MAADDEFALLVTREQVQQLRDDHEFLASMVQSRAGRRTVLYPIQSRRGSTSTGGAQEVEFTIDVGSVDCAAQTATGTVTDVLCGGTDGVNVGDTIDLVATRIAPLVGYPADNEGRMGMAVRMEQDDAGPYPTGCSWKITALEGTQVECS